MVCKSLRNAVDGDALLWRHLLLERPLSLKVTDSILLDLVSEAKGTLESLVLIDSWLFTDSALYLIAQTNPHITSPPYHQGKTNTQLHSLLLFYLHMK